MGQRELILMSLSSPVCVRYGKLSDAVTNKPQPERLNIVSFFLSFFFM